MAGLLLFTGRIGALTAPGRNQVQEVAMRYLIVLVILGAVGWHYYHPLPPGQGPEAEQGKRAAGRVVEMIESYREAKGLYPLELDDLVPDYSAGVPRMPNGRPYDYERLGSRYQLTFNYTNPAPVHCSYEPGTKWLCEWF